MTHARRLSELRRAVKAGDAERVTRCVVAAWLESDDADDIDWTPFREALDAVGVARDVQPWLPAAPITNAEQERDAVNRVARAYRRHYNDATADEREEGRRWYAEASTIADDIARTYGISRETSAHVIAVLSPNVSWAQNVNSAHCACAGWRDGIEPDEWLGAGYFTNKVKASAILNGNLDALRGPKVTVFARGILGDPDACTIDLWMARAAGLDHDSPTTREHRVLAAALRRVAREKGESVRDVQAIIWTRVRNESTRRVSA